MRRRHLIRQHQLPRHVRPAPQPPGLPSMPTHDLLTIDDGLDQVELDRISLAGEPSG